MKALAISIILSISLPSFARAQEQFPRRPDAEASNPVDRLVSPLPTAAERHAADVASWVTALVAIAIDTKASFDAPNRARAFGLQATRIGITYGAALAVKKMVGRERPCHKLYDFHGFNEAEVCGADDAFSSFYSAHTAVTFQAVGGARLAFALPLAIGTGGLRIAASKHWLTDTLVGAGAGLLTSRIR